ncbi:hypothetical protein VTN77DRAFT_6205 [Rasamsonia byssochlamydoides]|uniref:uncharacterized protein n=1 Tax=Rasamsonia byssochlamydoides TaxID=89139 RepID=UPI0037431A24
MALLVVSILSPAIILFPKNVVAIFQLIYHVPPGDGVTAVGPVSSDSRLFFIMITIITQAVNQSDRSSGESAKPFRGLHSWILLLSRIACCDDLVVNTVHTYYGVLRNKDQVPMSASPSGWDRKSGHFSLSALVFAASSCRAYKRPVLQNSGQ